MAEKRFTLSKDTEWWFVDDNTIQTNEFGYREDLTGEDAYRGLQQTLTEKETVEIMNELYEENQGLYKKNITIIQTITEAYNNERTAIGRSVLKQLINKL